MWIQVQPLQSLPELNNRQQRAVIEAIENDNSSQRPREGHSIDLGQYRIDLQGPSGENFRYAVQDNTHGRPSQVYGQVICPEETSLADIKDGLIISLREHAQYIWHVQEGM